jgi:hypothetical protein
LALPPAEAKLVRIAVGRGGFSNGQPMAPAYLLGFCSRRPPRIVPHVSLSGPTSTA